jgi:hypothetical protein
MRCPVCKADNVQERACRRCKADLSLLWEVEERRAALLASARHRLAGLEVLETGVDGDPAGEHAAAAGRLRAGVDALRVTAMSKLLGRDFAGAWRAYLAVKAASGPGE